MSLPDASLIGSRDVDPATAPAAADASTSTATTLSNTVQSFVASLPDDAGLREWLRGGMMPHLLPHPALLPVWLLLSPVWAGYRLYRFAVHGDVGDELSLSSASVVDDRLETGDAAAPSNSIPPVAPVAPVVVVPADAAELDTPRIVPLLPSSQPLDQPPAQLTDADDHVDIQLDDDDNRPPPETETQTTQTQ